MEEENMDTGVEVNENRKRSGEQSPDSRDCKSRKTDEDDSNENSEDEEDQASEENGDKDENGVNGENEETESKIPEDLIPPADLSLEPPSDSPIRPLDSIDDSDSEQGEPSSGGRKVQNLRKNIKDVLDQTQLDASTLAAQREESERLARVQEMQRIQREQLRQIAMDRHTKAEEKVLQLLQGPKIVEQPETETEEKKEVVTIEDSSSDDDCIVVSDDEDEPEEPDDEDPHNSGLHTNDAYNIPDDKGRVLVNFGHAEDEPDVFLAPQIAKIIKPHQIGGIRFLFDNIVESVTRYEQSTGFGCILAHSMGLGKTIQVVSFCDVFLRHTTSKTVLIIMPINTLQNWQNEFNMWLPEASHDPAVRTRNFKIFLLNDNHRTLASRSKVVFEWAREGGVLMIGYEMYRLLSMKKMARNRRKKPVAVEETSEEQKGLFDAIHEALVKPGPDLVICDEGHRIKNSHASISVALKQIKSRRRVVLTGYPLQNNLIEYWCMVDFVRPNYLGTKSEFSNMFERPIQNGQCVDSTPKDIQLMRFRAHVLHSLLLGFVQRRSHLVLQQSLPSKQEYVLLVRMTDFQRKLYETFMNEVVRKQTVPNPLKAFSVCCKIWNHPDVLFNFLKKREADLDLELDDESTSTSTATSSTPKKSLSRSRKKAEPVLPTPVITTTAVAPIVPKTEPSIFSQASNYSAPPPSAAYPQQYSQPYSSNSSTASSYPSYNNQTPYSSTTYPYQGKSEGAYQDPSYYHQYPYQQYHQYGQYYGSQNYYQSSSNYYPNQQAYQQYAGSEFGSQSYPSYPPYTSSSYPYQQKETPPALKVEKSPPEKPKSPVEIPKTVDTADFDNKLADEIKDEVEGDKSSEKGGSKDDTVPYDWALDLVKGYVPDLLENSPKMQIFFLLLEESIRIGDRILLFSQSLLTLNVIEKFLQKTKIPTTDTCWAKNVSYYRLDGSTVAQEREKLINSFNVNANVHLFLVSTRAGSLGINLVGANRVIVFDASWNPCHDTQAVCRVYRYGQKKQCFVYRIVMDACLEKKIYDRQISKQGMSDRVVDECNPVAHLSMKEVTSFCFDDDEVTEVKDFCESKEEYHDSVVKKLLDHHSKQLTKKPFQHESLLVDHKEKKLSASEKRMAKRGYELEKMNSSKPAYSYTSMGTTYRAYRTADGTLVHKAVPSTGRPATTAATDQTARANRSTTWIPAEVWQQQGMSAQEMTLPSDVVIPTSSADKENIVLKAGQRVMVLKSHKGIYMQLESGKIIAIRTAMKPENGAKKPADQPSTSTSDKPSTDSKTDTDDDDLIMTSITYPEPKVANNEIGVAPTQPGMYVNGSAAKPEPARRRGRPPTYNGYHPAYIPPGAVVQPLQPYSRAPTFKPAASYDKPKAENYIPQSVEAKSMHASAATVPTLPTPYGSNVYQQYTQAQHPPPAPPPPYPSQSAQTNGGQQWQ